MSEMGVNEDGVIGEICAAPYVGEMYREALDWMRRPRFLKSHVYDDQQWKANRDGAFQPLADWERAFVRRMAGLGVPVYAYRFVVSLRDFERQVARGEVKQSARFLDDPHHMGYAVNLWHSRMYDNMPPICWRILRHVGEEVAEAMGLDVEWGGAGHPTHWRMREWERYRWSPPPVQDFHVGA